MELSEFTNPIIEFEINGVRVTAKKANLKDLAELDWKQESTDMEKVASALKAIYLCVKKANPEITEEQVSDLFGISNVKDVEVALTKLGFMDPTANQAGVLKNLNGN